MNQKNNHSHLIITLAQAMRGAAFVLAFCVGIHAHAEPKKLVVGHDTWIGYSGVFVAKDKGFFQKEGLDVELKPFSNPGDTLPALVAGKLDIGLTTLHNLALLNGAGDSQISLVYLIDSSNGADAIVAKNDIPSVAALKGKTVGVTSGEVNEFLLTVGLEKAGLSEPDIKLVNMSADDAGAAFVAGKLDAAVTWEPWVTKAKTGGGHVIFSSAEIPDTILDCVALPKPALESRASEIKAFLKAIDAGVKFLRENPAEANAIIAKYLSVTPDEVKGMLGGDKVYSLNDNAQLLKPGGQAYLSMKRVVDFAAAHKLIEKTLDPAALIEPKFVAP